jgi:hypothetical protein
MNSSKTKTYEKSEKSEKYEIVVNRLLDKSIEKILTENYSSALTDLEHCESILETEILEINPYMVLSIFHNLSLCHQKLQNHEKTINYITTTIYKSKRIFVAKSKDYTELQVFKYTILRMLQLCAALSQVNNHILALHNAKKTLKYIQKLLTLLFKLITKKIKKKSAKNKNFSSESDEKLEKICKIIENIIQNKFEKVQLLEEQDWVNNYNMGNIMIISPFILSEWIKDYKLKTLLSLKFFTENIFFLISSYFIISIESRLLEIAQNPNSDFSASKEWHGKALEISKCYLPYTCPFLMHIKNSYTKNYQTKARNSLKKSIVFHPKRIFSKRNSEKPRTASEKSQKKSLNRSIQNHSMRKTITLKGVTNKIRVNKLKQSIKDFTRASTSKELNKDQTKSENILKKVLYGKNNQSCNESSSGSIDCNDYSAQEFKNNFVMTSKLLYGERYNTEKHRNNQFSTRRIERKDLMRRIQLLETKDDIILDKSL